MEFKIFDLITELAKESPGVLLGLLLLGYWLNKQFKAVRASMGSYCTVVKHDEDIEEVQDQIDELKKDKVWADVYEAEKKTIEVKLEGHDSTLSRILTKMNGTFGGK